MALRVLVLGKDPLARAGLAAMLGGERRLTVVAQGAPEDLDELAAGERLDALALDVGDGSAASFAALDGELPGVALVASDAAAGEALAAGARGVLARDATANEVAAALEAAAAGLYAIDPELATALLRPRLSAAPPGEPLTPRELEVLQLLSLGLANKAIAARLGISEHTAKFHVNAILAKLGAGSRAEAIVRAARAGLVAI